jgi:hypothetical protein
MKRVLGILLTVMFFAISAGMALPVNAEAKEYVKEAVCQDYDGELLFKSTEYERGGSGYIGSIVETITYSHKTEISFSLFPNIPLYATNYSCGVVAGGNIIGWYNRLYPSLIPGQPSGVSVFGTWVWSAETIHVSNMFSQLDVDMQTIPSGVSIDNYLNGMNTFVTRQGRTFSSTKVTLANGGLSVMYRVFLQSGQLMSIFVEGFNTMFLDAIDTPSQGVDVISYKMYAGGHVMAVYGFREISYFNAQNVMFRHDIYFLVNDGHGNRGMTRVTNFHGTFHAGYMTHIT